MDYSAPVDDIRFALRHMAGLGDLAATDAFASLDEETVGQVLEEAARFIEGEIAPLYRTGDADPARLSDGEVKTTPGWKEAYRTYVEGGWMGLPFPERMGGMGLPTAVNVAIAEMMNAANMAFGVGPLLTQGAIEAIETHGSDEQKAIYLPKLITGEWSGTMNLTEPQAGTDLALLKTRAEPAENGAYRIFGTKIFITYGEHDLTDNIVHLVLARLAGAPDGVKGISLFLVPKYLPDSNGAPGARNDVKCIGLEEKLGIHASPTCVMAYGEGDGAIGWLVGEPHGGLRAMFTMMNNARLLIGIQGVGIADRAGQAALAYARERRQGGRDGEEGPVAIVEHPDIRRSIAHIQATTAAARAICYATAVATDLARHARDADDRARHQARADLLTPVAKAWSTDVGVEAATIGLQVHGGMGYIEETGAAQILRDARIGPIYEGTNGIQAIDLVRRKIGRDDGAAARALIDELRDVADRATAASDPLFGRIGYRLGQSVGDLAEATDWMRGALDDNPDAALAGATPYLELFGLTLGGGLLARGALAASTANAASADDDDRARQRHILNARFFAETLMPATGGLRRAVTTGAEGLLAYDLGGA